MTVDNQPRIEALRGLRVALVHDWLVTLRGGERVLDAFCELFPDAVLHTLVRRPGVATPRIEAMRHASSFADKLPMAHRRHRWLLPLYPSAIQQIPLADFDVVLSSSHCVAKAVVPGPGAVHVCYSHTPVRYAWDRTDDYIAGTTPALAAAAPVLRVAARALRRFDLDTLDRVDRFIANSENTAGKIRRFYGRDADVVPAPVELDRFAPLPRREGGYDLVLGGMVPYKRVDLAVAAWAKMPERRLVIVGDGPERARLQRLATSNVEFVGRVEEDALGHWYSGANLLAFPGEEDFGIVPLEAQACGTPVVALGRGGALETVVDGITGIHFHREDPDALVEAVRALDAAGLREADIRAQAAKFGRDAFIERVADLVADTLDADARVARHRRLRSARARS
ncbi:MAG: hypothetical protein RIT45_1358 [Pseudomonadota bacterium]